MSEKKKNVHFIMQSKGGVGKSLVSTMLAQYFVENKLTPLCIDIDPRNDTFHQYKALNVRYIQVMDKKGDDYTINPRKFDTLIQAIDESKHDVIIDSGASAYIEFVNYLKTHEVFSILDNINIKTTIHCIISGGDSYKDTIKCFVELLDSFGSSANFILWINHYFGDADTETLVNSALFKENKDNILGVINIPILKRETFGADFQNVLENRLTIDEALKQKGLSLMERSRLTKIKKDWNEAIKVTL